MQRALQGLGHRPFVFLVEPRRWFVEHHDGCPADRGSGDRDPLALPVREGHATLADHRVVPLRQGRDERVSVGEAGGRLDGLGRGRGRPSRRPVGDVVPDRRREEEAVLENDADLGA